MKVSAKSHIDMRIVAASLRYGNVKPSHKSQFLEGGDV
jgi:hypothetical protein